jgi:hypothetical protein
VNLFLITSPLQYINAVEAKYHFGFDAQECVLCICESTMKNRMQLLNIINAGDWCAVHFIPQALNKYYFWLPYKILDSILKEIGKIYNIFIGEYRSEFMRYYAVFTKSEKIFLLDDGNVTIEMNKQRAASNGEAPSYERRSILHASALRLIGVKSQHIETLNYFTVYNVKPKLGESVVKNSFNFVKSKISAGVTTVDERIYFLGTELDFAFPVPIVKNENYMKLMVQVREYFNDFKIVYFPHRREPDEKLSILENELNFQVQRIDVPIEIHLVKNAIYPKILAGFYSTAFDNLKIIFPNIDSVVFPIDRDKIHPDYREYIQNIYDYYEENYKKNFCVVKL